MAATRQPNVAPGERDAATFGPRGGSFSVDATEIGRTGAGRITQRGGTAYASSLSLGNERGADADYKLVGGALVVRPAGTSAIDAPSGLRVGGAGTGALHLGGGGDSPGGAVFQPRGPVRSSDESPRPSLVVREKPDGSGLIEGWGGAIGDGGVFVNNGRVVADGAGRDRDLIFLGYGAVTNTIENSPLGGRNGWFARNNGRLALPKLPASAGTGTYTWGEAAADPTIDLVNSVRLTLLDAQNPGKIDVALFEPHRGDVPALPVGHTFIGIWSLDTGLTRPAGGVDLVVRYDDGLASELALDESVLKLWQYHDGQWLRINDSSFARDLDNHLLSGHADPRVTFIGVSAPEPGPCGILLVWTGLLSMRRSRRR